MNPHYVAVGASRGLGAVFAKMVVAAGGRVSVISRSRAVAPPAGHSSGIGGYQCDITDKDQVCATLAAIRRERGEFDGVVFFQRYRGDGDGWAGELAVSLTATKDVIELAVPHLDPKGDRSIVVVSSMASVFVSPTASAGYHVAKAGLCQLARYFACTLGKDGIRMNAVCPGSFVKPESEAYFRDNPEVARKIANASPLGRMGSSAEVVEAVLFLLSKKSSFITGQALAVDGGVSLRWQEHLDWK